MTMTTIIYDHENQLIAVDSRRCRGDDIISDDSKKYKCFENGEVWFFCGVTADFKILIDAFRNKTTGIDREIEAEAFAFIPEIGFLRVYFAHGLVHYDNNYDFNIAIGTGSPYALSAMDFGCDAIEAIEYAKKRDSHTGGRINVYSMEKRCFVGERMMREKEIDATMNISEEIGDSRKCYEVLERIRDSGEIESEYSKIKMTKTLPTDHGLYYWAGNKDIKPITVHVCGDAIGNLVAHFKSGPCGQRVDAVGGYWAPVCQSQFNYKD